MDKRTKVKKLPAWRLENRRLRAAGHSQENRSHQLNRGLRTIQNWDEADREVQEAEEIEQEERRQADAEALAEMRRVIKSLEDAKAELDTQRQRAPAKNQLTILQREVYDRCRLRSKKFPKGDHNWMTSLNDMQRYKDHSFSEEVLVEPADEKGFVTLRYIKTCSICSEYTAEWSVTDSLIALSVLDQLPYPMTIKSVNNDLKTKARRAKLISSKSGHPG